MNSSVRGQRNTGWRILVSVSLALTLSLGCGGHWSYAAPPPGPIYQDLPALVAATPLIIVGKVVDIRAGRIAGSGEGRLQFNDVRVSVERQLKGKPGASVIVEQVDMSGRIVLGAGPAYKTGERYVLFLRPGEGHRYITIPQGRYLLVGGSVRPIDVGPAVETIKGKTEVRFIEEIEAIVRTGR